MTQPTTIFDPARLRSHMERDGIDLVLATSRPNVGYLSNWFTHHWTWDWPVLVRGGQGIRRRRLPPARRGSGRSQGGVLRRLLPSRLERAAEEPGSRTSAAPGGPAIRRREGLESVILEPATTITHVESAVEAIKDHGFAEATIGVEMCRMAQSVYAELAERLPKARFVDCFEMMLEVRAVKSVDEVAKLRRAAEITTRCFNDVIFPMMRDKTTPYEIYQEAIALAARERGYFLVPAHVRGWGACFARRGRGRRQQTGPLQHRSRHPPQGRPARLRRLWLRLQGLLRRHVPEPGDRRPGRPTINTGCMGR